MELVLSDRYKRMAFFFSSFDPVPDDENHIFLALCEVSPGVIWAGGFTSGIYKIEKKKGFKISYLSPAAIAGIRPDQYIYDIKRIRAVMYGPVDIII